MCTRRTILRFFTTIWFLQEPMCTGNKLIYTFAKGQCDGKPSDIQFWFQYICNHFQRNQPVAEKTSHEVPRNCSSSSSFSSSLCFDKKFSKHSAGFLRCPFWEDFSSSNAVQGFSLFCQLFGWKTRVRNYVHRRVPKTDLSTEFCSYPLATNSVPLVHEHPAHHYAIFLW